MLPIVMAATLSILFQLSSPPPDYTADGAPAPSFSLGGYNSDADHTLTTSPTYVGNGAFLFSFTPKADAECMILEDETTDRTEFLPIDEVIVTKGETYFGKEQFMDPAAYAQQFGANDDWNPVISKTRGFFLACVDPANPDAGVATSNFYRVTLPPATGT